MTYTQQLEWALQWNDIFELTRMRLRWLEAVAVPTEQTRNVANQMKEAWELLTLYGLPHPERLHQNRFDRYNTRMVAQIARHAPPVLRLVK